MHIATKIENSYTRSLQCYTERLMRRALALATPNLHLVISRREVFPKSYSIKLKSDNFFQLLRNQTKFHLVPNQSGKDKDNLIQIHLTRSKKDFFVCTALNITPHPCLPLQKGPENCRGWGNLAAIPPRRCQIPPLQTRFFCNIRKTLRYFLLLFFL